MSLELCTITFNHNFNDKTISALNIRRNKSEELWPHPIPEYSTWVPRPAERSCAAYSLYNTKHKNVFIRVRFYNNGPSNATFEVKATGGGIMGELDPIQLVFSGAPELEVDIPLSNRKFEEVGRHLITWHWVYRKKGRRGSLWKPLTDTSHVIYLVLQIPQSPWTEDYGNEKNPWTDLLDKCCVIAAGSTDTATATRKITKAIYRVYGLRYDACQGAPRYCTITSGHTLVTFNLTNWITYVLDGNPPSNVTFCPNNPSEVYNNYLIVNCYDCAAALSVMAKVVGCQHANYNFHGPFGYLNYVKPIGRGKCNNPFYLAPGTCVRTGDPAVDPNSQRSYFGNHAYVRMRYPRHEVRTYDACMKQWLRDAKFDRRKLDWWWIEWPLPGWVKPLLLSRWLVDLWIDEYIQIVIDTSEDWEAQVAMGNPMERTVEIT